MEFRRFGKSFQMVLNDGNDLVEALNLDESLWVALSAPTSAFFRCDPKLFDYLDVNKNGRVTSKELRTAIKWLRDTLVDITKITPEFDGNLAIADISDKTAEGKSIIDSAKWISQEIGTGETGKISLKQVREFIATVIQRDLNGDGVLTLKAAQRASTDEYKTAVTAMVKDVVTATGGATDKDGTQGLDEATMTTFLKAVPEYLEWYDKGQIPEGQTKTDIMTMGTDTPALAAMVKEHSDKLDQFFKISNLLYFDERIQSKALSTESKVAAFDPAAQAEVDAYQNALPLSTPNADRILPLIADKINPACQSWFMPLVEKVILPILGCNASDGLTEDDWNKVKATFAAYEAYMASKKGAIVEKVPVADLRKYVSCDALQKEVRELMAIDKDVSNKIAASTGLEKLLLYRENLLAYANNFISFTDLYSREKNAMFECGKLVIDGRWFAVAFKITSVAEHQGMAKNSQLFLMYVEVTRHTGEKFQVVVPVTSGSKGNLMVGKRGIFYDTEGNDCDAKVINIVENPVCLREAIEAPIHRLWGIIEGKLNAWSGDAEKNLQGNFTKAITPGEAAAAPAPAPAPAAKDGKDGKESKLNANAFMGIGIAAAAIGSALAFITKTLAGMTGLQIWITVIVAILALMLPISIIAIIKLNRQDLSSILEGCGWGINMKVRLDGKLRKQFTYYGKYPAGAKGTPKHYALKVLLTIILLILLGFGGCKYYKYQKAQKEERIKQEEAAKALQEKKLQQEKEAAEKKPETTAEAVVEGAKKVAEEVKEGAKQVAEAVQQGAEEGKKAAEAVTPIAPGATK